MDQFISNEKEVDALLLGLAFMGTGGGGTIDMGKKLLMDALQSGKKIELVQLNELPDNALTICAYMMGSSSPMTEEKRQKMKSYGLTDIKINNMQAAAVQLMEKFTDLKVDAIMPLELGAAATSGAISSAAWLGLPVIDADYMGRALPEISQTLPVIHGEKMLPLASVDRYQNEAIINHSSSYQMGERLGKSVASASFDLAGQAAFLLSVNKVKKVSLMNTISSAFKLGKIIQKSIESKEDVISAILSHFNGKSKVLFKGNISKIDSYEQDGYFYGENHIKGNGEYTGNYYKIWFKNENILGWFNDKVDITSPDLIVIMDAKLGLPLLNGRILPNQEVLVIGIEAHNSLKTEKALKVLGPRHYNFDFNYQPMKL
ncbi:MAG: DUF917 domain-containing protein [Tatlockia sp.]|nr:DUF917 domain-containing protein [Tatlockia sp.]